MNWLNNFLHNIWIGIRRQLLICDCRSITLETFSVGYTEKFAFTESDYMEYALVVDRALSLHIVPSSDNEKWVPVKIRSWKGKFICPTIDDIVDHHQIQNLRREMDYVRISRVMWIPENLFNYLKQNFMVQLVDSSSLTTPPTECSICLYN